MPAPFYYDHINGIMGEINPSTVQSQNTYLTNYYKRYLLQRAIGVFDWKLPKEWDKGYFLYCLYCFGHVAVIETDSFGVIPQDCGLTGHGVQYQPTHAVISNPLLKGLITPRIGEACAVIRLMPDWGGIMDIVNNYAEALALTSEGLSFNLLNSKLAFVFGCSNKNAAETMKKMYDRINKGETAVFIDKDLYDDQGNPNWLTFNQNLKENFIAPDLCELKRRIICMFDNDIGIDANLAYNKKERINTAEVTANDHETFLNTALWLEFCKKGCEEANNLFDIGLSVDWKVKPEETEGGNGNAVFNSNPV